MIDNFDLTKKLKELETQLAQSHDKLLMRENVISQLEEEIKGKEQLIYEQGNLISILESDAAAQTQLHAIQCDNNNKYDAESITSDSEITVIEREIVASSSSTSPCSSEKSVESNRDEFREIFQINCGKQCRFRNKFHQAMVDRERLELQNEQLLKQWEEALEYVTSVQRQLQQEINRNQELKNEMREREQDDVLVVPRNIINIISFIVIVLGFLLYRL